MQSTSGRGVTGKHTLRGAWVVVLLLLAAATGSARADESGDAGTSGVTLEWTAPGDDEYRGEATRYDLRYSLGPISAQNFDLAVPVPDVPPPADAGTRQRARVLGLQPNRVYYFALKSVDDAGNWSLVSNVALKTAPDPTHASARLPVSLSPPYPSPARNYVRFEFTLPRDMIVHINLIDIGGRQVKTLAEGHYPAGTSVMQWDMINELGAKIGVGQYWLLGQLGETTFTHRLTVIP